LKKGNILGKPPFEDNTFSAVILFFECANTT